MWASNFSKETVLFPYETEHDEDWDIVKMNLDDISDTIMEYLESNWYTCSDYEESYGRNYQKTAICYIENWPLTAKLFYSAGYYSWVNFDYSIDWDDYDLMELIEELPPMYSNWFHDKYKLLEFVDSYSDIDDILRAIDWYIDEYNVPIKQQAKVKRQLEKMYNRAYKDLSKCRKQLHKVIRKAYENAWLKEYWVTARFSNWETIYSPKK